ncbi:MAG: phosphoribosylamine--glycine ligase [Candidatus Levybacteria bacterium RIFCSPLOWO2_01_FULL_39_10]|nr:MAG: phosphoribosylamine--glycine ligase [Candidatus Levybacteria bacterium RIFCSPLOWO2_01_FULL_39_10]
MSVEAPRNVLIVGSGAREHAIGWKIHQDAQKSGQSVKQHFAPGNAGTSELGTNHDIGAEDIDKITDFAVDQGINLVIFGSEAPLFAGGVNAIEEAARKKGVDGVDLEAFGPSQEAARLEGSKAFAVRFMEEYKIPHPKSEILNSFNEAIDYLRRNDPTKLVLKADGPALGKGVFLPSSFDEAEELLRKMMLEGIFGEAGKPVVGQERLRGTEASVIGFVSNEIGLLIPARDYKRAYDGDEGPNTGGIGAYAPSDEITQEDLDEIYFRILSPTREGMRRRDTPFKGALYAGLMLTDDGPQVLEYNVRFGDPETQVQMRLLRSNLLTLIKKTIKGSLQRFDVRSSAEHSVGVVFASGGYPSEYETGRIISGLDKIEEGIEIFHAGTRINENGEHETSGGRVLTVTATGETREEARNKTYSALGREGEEGKIWVEGGFYRSDIAA